MIVAYETRSQEDEHSCFSDNTVNDIIANARGIQNVWLGDFGALVGPGIVDLVSQEDPALADRLTMEIAASVAYATEIPFSVRCASDRRLAESRMPAAAPSWPRSSPWRTRPIRLSLQPRRSVISINVT